MEFYKSKREIYERTERKLLNRGLGRYHHGWSTIGDPIFALETPQGNLGVSKKNKMVSIKIWGLQKNKGVSNENMGVFNESLGVSNESLGVSKENLGVSTERLGSPIQIRRSPTKYGGPQRKSGGFQWNYGVSNENKWISNEHMGVSNVTSMVVSNESGSLIVLQ